MSAKADVTAGWLRTVQKGDRVRLDHAAVREWLPQQKIAYVGYVDISNWERLTTGTVAYTSPNADNVGRRITVEWDTGTHYWVYEAHLVVLPSEGES